MSKREDRKQIVQQALNQHQAISLPYDFAAEDVVATIQSMLPQLDIRFLSHEQSYGDWIDTLTLQGKTYQFKAESNTLIIDIMRTVNQQLTDRLFVLNPDADEYDFVLIDAAALSRYLETGFCKP